MITESLLIKEGIAERGGRRPGNSPQIAVLPDPAEHLRETEGVHDPWS